MIKNEFNPVSPRSPRVLGKMLKRSLSTSGVVTSTSVSPAASASVFKSMGASLSTNAIASVAPEWNSELPKRVHSEPVAAHSSNRDILIEKTLDLMEKQRLLNERLYNDNNGWNRNLEMIAARIGERASGLRWMHLKCVSYYALRYQVLGIIVILVQTGTATGAITQISACSTGFNVVTLLVGLFTYLATVVSSLNQFKNWGALTQNHKQSMVDLGALEQSIRVELSKYRRDRNPGATFIEFVGGHFDDINSSAPNVPQSIQKKYKQFIQGKQVADANDSVEPVEIKTESPEKSEEHSEHSEHLENSNPVFTQSHPPESMSTTTTTTTTNIVTDVNTTDKRDDDIRLDFLPETAAEKRHRYELERYLQGNPRYDD